MPDSIHLFAYRKQKVKEGSDVRISFQTQGTEKQQENVRKTQQGKAACREQQVQPYGAAFFVGNDNNWIPNPVSGNKEKSKSLAEMQQEAGCVDVGVRQDYMTVMANTMSEEDYAKLEEEGFHFSNMDPQEAVTIVDKIKAELARSGEHIVGYTDDISMDTLAAAVGSDNLARAITHSFESANVPLTQENLDEVKRAWDMASQLQKPGEGASHYMIDNQAEPEIWDFYMAQNSGAERMTDSAPRYYAEDVQGYYTQSAGSTVPANLQQQIDKIITEAGMEINQESRQNAEWLVEQGLPLTADNLVRLQELEQVEFPVSVENFAQAAAAAILAGKSPVHGNLADTENIYAKAAMQTENFWKQAESLLSGGDITARRQLEEIRLRMTAEVNVKLIKSGFSIDTAPMEELLAALKQAEAELAESYFPQDSQALEKYDLYRQTNQTVSELPSMPARILGEWSIKEAEGTLQEFHERGRALQEAYDKAQESYEALMTAPRKDMGDSIQKAFANVDDILEDLRLELNEENRRAVRILGYNRMELTAENIEKVKAADNQVRDVIKQLSPSATLKMIREGVNPLEMSFEELETYFSELPAEYEENAESYSRFLYQLEQNKEITESEREAYIGIYRMVRQLEKSDGAAIGAVVNTGAELQLANLLSAVRSGKFRHMDVKITDEFGLVKELVREGKSISGQINEGIAEAVKKIVTEVSSDEETDARYRRLELEQIRQAAQVQPEGCALLAKAGLSGNADNLLAAQMLLKDFANPFKKVKDKTEELEAPEVQKAIDGMEKLLSEEELPAFEEGYKEAVEEMKGLVEDTTEMLRSSVDVREMQLIHKQLTVMAAMPEAQEFIVPMYIGDELGRVHLTLINGEEQKGMISIGMDWSEETHAEAHLQVSGEKVTGYLVGNREEEVTKLKNAADIFHKLLNEDASGSWEVSELPVVSRGMEGSDFNTERTVKAEASDNTKLYRIARIFLQAMKG